MRDQADQAHHEAERLAALRALCVLDTPREAHLDAVCRLAAGMFGAPTALLSMIDETQLWFKASESGDRPACVNRDVAFCGHTIKNIDGEPLVVTDLTRDVRFADNRLVTGAPHARFYAGAPIALQPGLNIGALCVIDTKPRPDFSDEHIRQLKDLALIVTAHLRLHEANIRSDAELVERERIANLLVERDQRLRAELDARRMAEQIACFGHWRIDVGSEAVTWSEGVGRIYGREGPDHATMTLDTHLSFYAPEDAERVRAVIVTPIRAGRPPGVDSYESRCRVMRPDGEVRQVIVRGAIECDPSGKPVAVYGVCVDVTDLARSEETLQRTTILLRATLENMDQGLVMTGADGRVVVHNQRASALLGLGDAVLEDGADFAAIVRGVGDGAAASPWSAEAIRANGRTIEVRAAALADGSVVRTLTDVTARQIAEQALRASEASYKHLADTLPLMVWSTDEDGVATYVNEHFRQFHGQGRRARDSRFGATHPDDFARMIAAWNTAEAARQSFECEARIINQHGAYRWHKVSATPIERKDAGSAWLATALDIDEIVKARETLQGTTELLRLAQDAAGAGIWEFDLRSGLVWQSPESARMQQLALDPANPSAGVHMSVAQWESALSPEDKARVHLELDRALAGGNNYECEFQVAVPTGGHRWLHGFGRIDRDTVTGDPLRFVGMNLDITARKEAEAAFRASKAKLRASEERLAHALDSGSDGLWDIDITTGATWYSDRLQTMLGYAPGEIGSDKAFWKTIIHPEDYAQTMRLLRNHVKGKSAIYESEHRMITKTGGTVWIVARGKAMARDEAGVALRVVGTHIDITERKAAERRVAHLASHDVLTDLPNRALFHDRLQATLGEVLRSGQRAAVLCLDLDRFKAVNDTLGHLAGDTLLQVIAQRLRAGVREGDTVARLGGDEFAIILGGVDDPDAVAEFAERMIDAVGEALDLDGRAANVGVSIGIALAPADGVDADALLRHADLALYRAKAGGRNMHCFYEAGMDAANEVRTQLEFDLREAVLLNGFSLRYQPVVGLGHGAVVGCEALLRWAHPSRGAISPADFIPLAEETGLIVPLGDWVLREACREAATWPGGQRIAVNVSAVQFRKPGLEQSVLRALGASGLPASRLELEITESVLMQDNEAVIACLHRLRKIGVRIALDDFGTGYSSLAYLRQFPFDKIKIDRSFIGEIAQPDTAAIVRAIVGLGERLGIAITAEGVETESQLELVRREGCNEVQGFYYSPPLLAADLRALLARGSGLVEAA